MRPSTTRPATLLAAALVAGACGGDAYYDPGLWVTQDTGQGGGQTTATTTGSTTSSSSLGGGNEGGGGSSVGGAEPIESTLEEIDLGVVKVDELLTFEVPENTLGFTTIIQPFGNYGRVGAKQLQSPTQQKVIDNYKIDGTDWVFSWYGITVAAVPQSDAASAMPKVKTGTWQLLLGNPFGVEDQAQVSVWLRRTHDGAFHGGVMDVNVFIAANAAPESHMDEVLALAFKSWAGIELGSVSYFALGPQWSVIDETSFLQLEKKSIDGKVAPALNLFVVSDLTGEMEQAAGISPGIPGQGIVHGTHASGVVMEAIADLDLAALVVRHEAGHLAGLFHTSEIAPGFFDPLSDTPTCSDVMGKLYECADAGNIMFPVANPEAITFSTMQQRVLQGSSLYRGTLQKAPESSDLGNPPDSPSAAPPAAGNPAAHSSSSLHAGKLSALWKQRLGTVAAHLITSHWCTHFRRAAPVAHATRLSQLLKAPQLLALAQDHALAPFLRKRALLALEKLPRQAPISAAAQTLAMSPSQPRAVRLGALRLLAAHRIRPSIRALRKDPDAVVARLAERLQRK